MNKTVARTLITPPRIDRREFIQMAGAGLFVAGVGAAFPFPAWGKGAGSSVLTGTEFIFEVAERPVNFTGKDRMATVINGLLPGPVLRVKEGDTVTIRVTNKLKEMTSIHWHGIILDAEMDGVPGISFPGIEPGETFVHTFKLEQSGTYWYPAHTLHEQTGMYGALIVEPKDTSREPKVDRDYPVILSDWTDENPVDVYMNLKKMGGYYNYQKLTLGKIIVEQLEYRNNDGNNTRRWDIQGWRGKNYNKFWFKFEGENEVSTNNGELELQALYSRAVSAFWDFQIGGRYDREYGGDTTKDRFFAVVGFQGLAPYWFEADPSLYVSEDGDVSARLGDLGITISNVLIRRMAGWIDALSAMGWPLIIGSFFLALIAFATEDMTAITWNAPFILSLLGLALPGTALAYWLWFRVLRQVELNRANAFSFLVPIFGLSMGVVFFQESIGTLAAAGIGLIMLGIILVNLPRKVEIIKQ